MLHKWQIEKKPIEYGTAMETMKQIVNDVCECKMLGKIWVLEHFDVYTIGTSGKEKDILNPDIPNFITSRGGQVTYHGIGQRIVYPIINVKKHMIQIDIRKYVKAIENWIIRILRNFGIQGEIRNDRVGVWVSTPGKYFPNYEAKIAAIGIRVSKGVAYHGFAVNINPDLKKYKNIIPCGLNDYGVTSFEDLGVKITQEEFDSELIKEFPKFLEEIKS